MHTDNPSGYLQTGHACALDRCAQSVSYDKTILVGTWHTWMPWGAACGAPVIGTGSGSALGPRPIAPQGPGRPIVFRCQSSVRVTHRVRPRCATEARRPGSPGVRIGLIVSPDLAWHTLARRARPLKQGRDIGGRPGGWWFHHRVAGALHGGSHRQGADAGSPAALDERAAGCCYRQSRGTARTAPGRGAGQRGADLRSAGDSAPAAHRARDAAAWRGTAQDRLWAPRAARSPSRAPGPAAFRYRRARGPVHRPAPTVMMHRLNLARWP